MAQLMLYHLITKKHPNFIYKLSQTQYVCKSIVMTQM